MDSKKKLSEKNKTILIIGIVVVSVLIITLAITLSIVLLSERNKRLNAAFPHLPIIMDEKEKRKLEKKFGSRKEVLEPSIFVSISSYRDPELCFTLQDLYDKAFNPKRIFVGVVEQNDVHDSSTCHAINAKNDPKIEYGKNIQIITLNYRMARGPTHARSICEGLLQDQDYYMMCDSHMRFEPGWDVELLDMLFKTKRPMKTVITMYPEGYERYENKQGKIHNRILVRKGFRYEQLKNFNGEGIVEFESVTSLLPIPKTPQYVPIFAACFMFSHSDFVRQVPFHPDTPYLFFGEEMFMGVRALSHGFDLVGPRFSVIYHLWKRDYRKTFWDHDISDERDKSIKKIKDIMTGKIIDEKYGMGNKRSWIEIQDYLGIDFEKQKFTRSRQPWKLPKDFRIL